MERTTHLDATSVVPDWRGAANYTDLLDCDRRAFAWEWLRRSPSYRAACNNPDSQPGGFGLVAFADPALPVTEAKPIWAPQIDPKVLSSRVSLARPKSDDEFDIRMLSPFVSVEVDGAIEHWLLTNGKWSIRLDLHDGTLLGGPLLLDHHLFGLTSAEPKMLALKQLVAISRTGEMPVGLLPRETRAPRWILELRTADAVAAGANQQEIARALFGQSIARAHWRNESASYRLRVQRLVRAARKQLDAPLIGPWFE